MSSDKDNLYGTILSLVFALCIIAGVGIVKTRNTKSFEKKLEALGLHSTELKYIYEDNEGNVYHCVPASSYRQEVIEKM